MIDVFPFAGYPVAVFGLGRSGLTAAKSLIGSEAEVAAWVECLVRLQLRGDGPPDPRCAKLQARAL